MSTRVRQNGPRVGTGASWEETGNQGTGRGSRTHLPRSPTPKEGQGGEHREGEVRTEVSQRHSQTEIMERIQQRPRASQGQCEGGREGETE